jgi:hypothetical protein
MPENKIVTFHAGVVTARDPATLNEGEMVAATGCEYREGSPHLYKQPGRASSAGGSFSVLQGSILAIHHFQYDYGTDKLIFYVNTGKVCESNVWTTSAGSVAVDTLAGEVTGLSTTAIPAFSSLRDRWIMVNGVDSNYIREPEDVVDPDGGTWSTGAWRKAGMVAPTQQLSVETFPAAAGQLLESDLGALDGDFTDSADDFTDRANAQDGDLDTFAYGEQDLAVGAASVTQRYGWTTNFSPTVTNAVVRMVVSGETSLRRLPVRGGWRRPPAPDTDARLNITVTDDGTLRTNVVAEYSVSLPLNVSEFTIFITNKDLSDIEILFEVENLANINPTSGWIGYAIGRVHTITADNQAASTAFSVDNDLYYSYTEVYEDSAGIEHESNMFYPPVKVSTNSMQDIYGIKLGSFPGTAQNDFAKKYRIYRSLDETAGNYPLMYQIDELLISDVNAGSTTWTDSRLP